ncbi:MAG: glycosyltransferase [Chloroflexi bacterium]|nr:glycosyltransferase [Chloroflexota bacterium]MCL5274933.1 glycosyltransferase [Chloroflexota bacterium]
MRALLLSTWFPYPLSQGSKIRAYYLLRALADHHEVGLISFADTAIEPAWVDHMSQWCRRVEVVQRDPFATSNVRKLMGRLTLRPSSVVSTYSSEMAERVKRVVAEWRPDCIVALTFVTAPYALHVEGIATIVDVDNLLTRMLYESYIQATGRLSRLRSWLAWWKFQRYERYLFGKFNACMVVSPRDKLDLEAMLAAGRQRQQIDVIPNGVDLEYNVLGLAEPEPCTLIFSGALTYFANYDAIRYFLSEIFPRILAQAPMAKLYITGKTDQVDLSGLALNDHVVLTGYLDDVRPAVARAHVSIAPLRIGAGSRVKILEAMALGTPVVCTAKAAEGLDVVNEEQALIADTPDAFASAVILLLQNPAPRERLARRARRLVEDKYDWRAIGRRLCDLVENTCLAARG